MEKTSSSPSWISEVDLALCLRFNRVSHVRFWREFFRVVSRLGDGVFWYVLMALMPIAYGATAWPTVGRMVLAGLLGLAAYKWLKAKTSRPRPYQVYTAISAATPALDRFSFPSGHTLHAVTFSLIAVSGFPALAPLVYPFAFLVAVSRPVLGLHYPSDVIAGALLGAGVAQVVTLI